MSAPPCVRRLQRRDVDLLALHAFAPERYPFLLESASRAQEHARSRWSLVCAASGERLVRRADGSVQGPGAEAGTFLAALDAWFARDRGPAHPELPFAGGWFLYLGYELAAEIEPRLRLPAGPAAVPVAVAERVRAAALRDHASGDLWLVAEAGHEAALDALMRDLDAALASRSAVDPPATPLALPLREDEPARYLAAVERALDYIAAGDVYQANLARAWRGPAPAGVAAPELYARLRRANPGPFAGLARLPGLTVLSTSPERLVEARGRRVETRPIAGTRPRRGDDAATIAELRGHPKEQAEHVMLLDLERNDLGRICEAGTVEVDEYMAIESYAHVHHIVSNVRGVRRTDVTPGVVIRALFPGGTITGCPKVRCMEIIAELEGEARGAYTGSMGYLGRDGALDLNILIRTATIAGEELAIRAGAGIVADSVPARELDETRAKARGLLAALTGGTP
ncbi:MAG: aminodeoxychorismate synthase component I [Pseudomonadota bacterium]